MQQQDLDDFAEISFRFASWLRKNFPDILEEIGLSDQRRIGDVVRETPVTFWTRVGNREFAALTILGLHSEISILDKTVLIVANSKPQVSGQILVGFVEGHMWPRPLSPLAQVMGEKLGMDLRGYC